MIARSLCTAGAVLLTILALTLNGCGANHSTFLGRNRIPTVLPVPNVSPYLNGFVQGVAIDPWGDHYISFTHSIAAYDPNWKLVWKNSQPFSDISVAVNHIGDIEYYGGYIYAPLELFKNCTTFAPVLIAVYDADTGALVNWVDITAQGHEASAAAVIPDEGQVVISSYCPAKSGASTLWNYDLESVNNRPAGSAVANQSTITLSSPISSIQGLSWYKQARQFLVSADLNAPAGTLWFVSGTGEVTGPVFTVPADQGIELEGVDATTGNAYYAENGFVYGIDMPTTGLNTGQATR
jgi:hypothetical protein